ncbi:MAK10-like protein [Tanacetum coccineum]|uniref:MAK10-like protein n=1 Tax=Tanacetum coccineum TaxID=301880 RepID=A0ABQ5B1X5_9ASTR
MSRKVESSGDEEDLGEDVSKQGRRINAIDADEDITLVNVQDDADNEIFDVDILTGDEVFAEQEVAARGTKVQDKGKGIMVEPKPMKPINNKFQIMLDEDIALKLQEEINEGVTMRSVESCKECAGRENNHYQPKINKKKTMITYLKNIKDLVEGSSKRAGEELEQESTKKQKVDEDKDTTELQSLMEVIPDEEEVAIDVVPLATKSPKIVGWKIHKEGKKSYYQIMRADGKSQMYRIFSQMIKSFDMEDLEDLYKLVKARYGSTRPVEDLDLVLWNDLKTMFEPHVEDEIWKLQQRIKSLLDDVSITAALIDVNAAQSKLVLLENFNENYSKCLRLLYKVNVAEGVNAASEEVSTAELVSTAYVISSNWLERLPAGSITTWDDITTRFLAQLFPPKRTTKLRNDILMLQQHQGESLSEAWTQNLALYDNESWNDPRDFAKPVKEISLPQDVPNTSDRRLIELKNQVQRLMEAHLAPKQPIQVNKITSSCEICSGPHDTQYCIENPEQAFVEYASSRTDEAGGEWYTFKPQQNNLGDTYNPSWRSHPNLRNDKEREIEWLDVEEAMDLVDTSEESVYESLIKEDD